MVKQESPTRTAPASIASRIAKYAYTTTLSPRHRRPQGEITVKAEFDDDEAEVERSLRVQPDGSVLSSTGIQDGGRNGTPRSSGQPGLSAHRPEIQTPDRNGPAEASPSIRRSARTMIARRRVTPSHDPDSDEDVYEHHPSELGSEDSESENDETVTPRRQTRIRARRANKAERTLLPGPSGPSTPVRKRRRRAAAGDGSDEEREQGPARRGRAPRGYADPELYQHLRPLPDILAPDLDIVFCGINPGMKSSKLGHHFAHPTNKFWRSLHYSGLTGRLVPTTEDHLLPTEFNYGMTVLVDRPTAEQSELSTHEMRLNALPFTEKLLRLKPRIVCFVGKKIWDVYENVVAKSATTAHVPLPPGHDGGGVQAVKQDPEASQPTPPRTPARVKNEDGTETPLRTVDTSTATPRRKVPKVKTPFDWTQPRAFRLPHPSHDGEAERYTYFWVVPNTSGLERTPLAEQIVLFGHLNTFKHELLAGRTRDMAYREFNVEGVRTTVAGLQRAAEARNAASPAIVKAEEAE